MKKNDTTSEDLALFRYSLIAPALQGTFSEKNMNRYFLDVASKQYNLPDGSEKTFNVNTIKHWYYDYKKGGFSALKHTIRSDFGISKKIPISVLEDINEICKTRTKITKRALYKELCNMGVLDSLNVAESTFYRFLSLNQTNLNADSSNECKAYQAKFSNDIWQADTSPVMRIKINNSSQPVHLLHIIDDASRLIVGYALSFADNAIVFQDTLKKAVKTFGIPKILYVDNGKTYSNKQLSLICANLGIQLIHAKPYSPRGKGKVERCFRTVQDKFFNTLDWNTFSDIDQLLNMYSDFLCSSYQNSIHSALNESPRDRFIKDFDNIKRKSDDYIDECFLHTDSRKVRNDATISFCNRFYEVPQEFINKTIVIKYKPSVFDELFIYDNSNQRICSIKPVDKVTNSTLARSQYPRMYTGDEND